MRHPGNSNDAHLIMIDDDIGDELDHAASATSTGATKEDDLLLPPCHQSGRNLLPPFPAPPRSFLLWTLCLPADRVPKASLLEALPRTVPSLQQQAGLDMHHFIDR